VDRGVHLTPFSLQIDREEWSHRCIVCIGPDNGRQGEVDETMEDRERWMRQWKTGRGGCDQSIVFSSNTSHYAIRCDIERDLFLDTYESAIPPSARKVGGQIMD
jgi:hypothetical protein